VCAAEAEAAPIGDHELESLFAAFPRAGRLLLAVSGGADSTALLLLAARWRAGLESGPELIAATIDHGLRPQSKEEARTVDALAGQLGVEHATLPWRGAKPETGIEAAARAARRRLLLAFAQRREATHIATAHTLDDQAETVLLRLAAGSGPAGLAAMRPVDRREGMTWLRPFLGIHKHRLIATLIDSGVTWSEDPMNRDEKFARPRLRAAAGVLAREGLTPERLGRLAARVARWEDVVAASAEAARDALGCEGHSGLFDAQALAAAPEELALRVLTAEVRAVGGELSGPHAPRLERVEALWEALRRAILAGQPARRTLGGAVISVDAKGAMRIARAAPRRSKKPSLARSVEGVHQE
jgi:tRNA(Ile)-lysidine synthase